MTQTPPAREGLEPDKLIEALRSASAQAEFTRGSYVVDGNEPTPSDYASLAQAVKVFLAAWNRRIPAPAAGPIPMILHCPKCGLQHIDQPEPPHTEHIVQGGEIFEVDVSSAWTNPPHRSHLCHGCGRIWRPADVPTEGVAAIQTRGKADSPAAGPIQGEGAQTLQARVKPWMDVCFGPEISADKLERNDRFMEEAVELVQASGYPASRAHELVEYVYNRPQGDINQEVGGVMITLAAHCLAHGVDMHEAGETELARIWTKVEQIREKQKSKPKGSALPIPTDEGPLIREWQARASTNQGGGLADGAGAADGWALVPMQPTEAMLKAANKASLSTEVLMDDTPFACERATYVAAVRQALSPPAGETAGGGE